MTNLETELQQFCGGSETFYRHPFMRKFIYTAGVQYLAEKGGAYWLIDYVFSNQIDPKIKDQPFQAWIIKVKENKTATITVEDGDKQVVKRFNLSFTDFPIEKFSLWFIDNTLLLPCEY